MRRGSLVAESLPADLVSVSSAVAAIGRLAVDVRAEVARGWGAKALALVARARRQAADESFMVGYT